MAKKDGRGHWRKKDDTFVHPDMVPVDKQLEDELVEKLVAGAVDVQEVMKKLKN